MAELTYDKRFEHSLAMFIKLCQVELVDFPEEDILTQEYAMLRRSFGPGESACMAVARHYSQFIASSNLRDIRAYCEQHSITYYTTFDILHLAVSGRCLTVDECDEFIKQVRATNSRLPFSSYQEFLRSNPRRP
ncbi:hypothetical protein GCM10023185_41900 [Hymenobacter saemangeumensis]|uniref:PIN domain-containing protein n=1 Tax=Hymenobacter saemangeumensis TaxID=1084522 RepID=A0ABP8IRZ2_9BACT